MTPEEMRAEIQRLRKRTNEIAADRDQKLAAIEFDTTWRNEAFRVARESLRWNGTGKGNHQFEQLRLLAAAIANEYEGHEVNLAAEHIDVVPIPKE